MNTGDYAPDAICHSLGIGSFFEPRGPSESAGRLRMLFCPSFDPEVCVTITEEGGRVKASVDASRTRIWTLLAPGIVTVDACETLLVETSFAEIMGQFEAASRKVSNGGVAIDGMSVHFGFHRFAESYGFTDNLAVDSPLGRFVATMIGTVFQAIDHVRCRNALAKTARYIGLELPVQPEPDLPPVTHLAILGAQEDQDEVLKALAAVATRRT